MFLTGSRISSTDEAGFTKLGDMIINSKVSNGGMQNSGRKSKTYRWPAGVVPYKIESSFSAEEETSIEEAIESLNNDLEGCVNIRYAVVTSVTLKRIPISICDFATDYKKMELSLPTLVNFPALTSLLSLIKVAPRWH